MCLKVRSMVFACLAVWFWFAMAGCATREAVVPEVAGTVVVPGNQAWTATGITLAAGAPLLIEEASPDQCVLVKSSHWQAVSARGSYLLDAGQARFPLEPDRVGNDRRYPGHCLIGRIGETGVPFHVGSRFQGRAAQSGQLWLGINDPAPRNNRGAFRCRIVQAEPKIPVAALVPPVAPPSPIPDATVVIFFVDGLRPDVAMEMAASGHLPNFRKLFVEHGTWIRNSFTVQPSLTLTCFSSMVTGTFANRHGVKMQCYYDRQAGRFINGLSIHYTSRFANEVEERGVKAIYDYFPGHFGSGAMPYDHLTPNVLETNRMEWLHRALNTAGYASNVKSCFDEAQTRFGLDLVSLPETKVMLFWLPATDIDSEHSPNGQFGGARPAIARMDECLGQIIARLEKRQRFGKTYFALISDHGHVSADQGLLRRFDLQREIFHAHLQMNAVDVRHQVDCPGAPSGRLGAIADSDGAVGIFLPRGQVDSRDLKTPNSIEQLFHYGLANGRQVNAIELFAEHGAAGRWPVADGARPVDFAVAKVDAASVLIHKTADRQALIQARRQASGIFEFKYLPVRQFAPGQPLQAIASGDPLGYLDSAAFRDQVGDVPAWLAGYHTGREWLLATCGTNYPGCIDALALYFRWDPPPGNLAAEPSRPDLLLFASKGWSFEPILNLGNRHDKGPGSRHGMAFRETVNNCLFFAGPGIRQGAIVETPYRMVDFLPTVLEMMSKNPQESGLDGIPIGEIWGPHER